MLRGQEENGTNAKPFTSKSRKKTLYVEESEEGKREDGGPMGPS